MSKYIRTESKCKIDAFAVVTGTIKGRQSSHINMDYPTGFTKDNCIILSVMRKAGNDVKYSLPLTGDYGNQLLELANYGVVIWDTYVYTAGDADTTYTYEVVLMKI